MRPRRCPEEGLRLRFSESATILQQPDIYRDPSGKVQASKCNQNMNKGDSNKDSAGKKIYWPWTPM